MSRFWEWLFKFLIFNAAIVGEFVISIKIFGVTLDEFKMHLAYVLLGLGNAAFILYDVALTKLIRVYLLIWQSYVHKFIKH